MTTAEQPVVRRPVPRRGLWSWALYDCANQPFPTVIQTFVFAAFFTRAVVGDKETATSQWGLAAGIAGIVVALAGPVLGAIVDQRGRRKPWLGTFTIVCIAATAALWFVKPDAQYALLALTLVAVGTIASELAVIFYNAMLPSLVPADRIGRWSGWGWGLGYAGGVCCMLIALAVISWGDRATPEGQDASGYIRAVWPLVACWYAVFALPLFFLTPDAKAQDKKIARAAREGLEQLWSSLKQARRFGHILRFLVAHMIYNDALATLFVIGGTYAAGTFNMSESRIAIFGVALTATAGLGAIAFAWFDDWVGGKRTVIVSLVGLAIPAALILLVESQVMFWTFGLLLGIFVGPAQAGSRSFLARVTPEPLHNQMFGLYALSGKATAFLGPLVVSFVTYQSGSQRIGMSVVVVLFVLGLLVMLSVPTDRPKELAEKPPRLP